ncbi:MAG: hypothetical protein KC613_26020, partial [Myxococcales bacterium]|nr:hypothetical protein [Myxococcales bacterium]
EPEPQPEPEPGNLAPRIDDVRITPADFANGCITQMQAMVSDPDGDDLTVRWRVDGQAPAEAPGLGVVNTARRGMARVQVEVIDAEGARAERDFDLPMAPCALPPGAVAHPDGQSAYLDVEALAPYELHRINAVMHGGRLLEIDDEGEQIVVDALIGGRGQRYMGLRRTGDGPEDFARLSGGSLNYRGWCPGEPNSAQEPFGVFGWGPGGCWNDTSDGQDLPAIYEFHLPEGAHGLAANASTVVPELAEVQTAAHTLTVDQRAEVTVRITDLDGACQAAGDPLLSLGQGGETLRVVDDADGTLCPRLTLRLEPGAYDVRVSGYGGGALPEHIVAVDLVPVEGFVEGPTHALTTVWTGEGRCLGVDGTTPQFMDCGQARAAWQVRRDGEFYRLSTAEGGEGRCLDVINDGRNDRLHLVDCGPYTGQFFRLTPTGNGFFRLTTDWQGPDRCLDTNGDTVHLADCGGYVGQFWRISER